MKKNIKVLYSSRCTSHSNFAGSRYTNYPKIQMEGKWLEALGFHVGDILDIEYAEGKIQITLAPKTESVSKVAEASPEYDCKRKRSKSVKI